MAFFSGGSNDTRRLEAQLQNSERQLRQFESALQKSNAELEKVRREKDELKQDVRAANEKYTSMVGDAERHSKELTQKDGALQSLQSQLSKMRQEKTNADIQLRQANTGLAENAAELNAVKENVKGLEQERDHLRFCGKNLEQKMASLKSEHTSELERLLKSLQARDEAEAAEKHSSMQIQGMSPNTVTRKLNVTDQMSSLLEESKDKVARLTQEGDKMRTKLVELCETEAKTGSLESEVLALRLQVREAGGKIVEMAELKRKMALLESENVDCKAQWAEMKSEVKQMETIEEEAKSLRAQCEVSEKVLANLEDMRIAARQKAEELADLQRKMASLADKEQVLLNQVAELKENLQRASDTIHAKERMLEAERALTQEERARCGAMLKDLQESQVEVAKLAQQLKGLSEKDKRASSVVEALERRVEEMKMDIYELESKLATSNKELSHSQSEVLGLHNQLQLASSQLFDARADNTKIKDLLAELERARNVPNLALSRSDLFEMELKYTEEKRLLKMELMSEKSAHQQTKQQLKDEHDLREQAEQKEKEATRRQTLYNSSTPPTCVSVGIPTCFSSPETRKRKAVDSTARNPPSAPPKYLRSASHQTSSDVSPSKPFTTGRIPSIFSYGEHSSTPEKAVSPLHVPVTNSTDASPQLRDLTTGGPAKLSSPKSQSKILSSADMEGTQNPRLSASAASPRRSVRRKMSNVSTSERQSAPNSATEATPLSMARIQSSGDDPVSAPGIPGNTAGGPESSALKTQGESKQSKQLVSPTLNSEDDDQDEFFSADGGSTPMDCAEENLPPPSDVSEVSFGSSVKGRGVETKQSCPLPLSNACENSPAKSVG